MKINSKSEKGAITLVVLIGMLFLSAFLMSMYIQIANRAQNSAETTKQISEQYNNINEADTIYESYFADIDIIPIYTKEQLLKIGSMEQVLVNDKIYTFSKEGYYIIKNDLDLGGVYDEHTGVWSGEEWTPLTNDFSGILDGLGHTITGIYINNSQDEQGLFGTLKGTVKNLMIKDSYISGNTYVGSIAGKNEGKIINCYNSAPIIGNTNVTGGYFKSITTGEQIDVWNENVLEENAYFVSGSYTAMTPKGFRVSMNVLEQTIEDGMVIQDENENEFVWVPIIEDFDEVYDPDPTDSRYEPKSLGSIWEESTLEIKPKYDSQDILNMLYGTDYYTYTDGMYEEEFAEMVENVNKHRGFYIGRYETTIDDKGNIGSKYNTNVLLASRLYTNNSSADYRWYGLYHEQKKANVVGNGDSVQTTMIYGAQWDRTMEFIKEQALEGRTSYTVDKVTPAWHTGSYGHSRIVKSGQANPGENGDVALNIWDLESNAMEWTQEALATRIRICRRWSMV